MIEIIGIPYQGMDIEHHLSQEPPHEPPQLQDLERDDDSHRKKMVHRR